MIRVTAEIQQELEAISADLPEESRTRRPTGRPSPPPSTGAARPRGCASCSGRLTRWTGGLGTRFLPLPGADSRAGYEDMEAFIETVASLRLQERLWGAIRGRGAFRRFKDVLAGQPAERERWFAFRDGRVRQRALAWLAEEGIEPVEEGG